MSIHALLMSYCLMKKVRSNQPRTFLLFLIQQNLINGSTESRFIGGTDDDLWLTGLGDENDGR